MGTMKTKEQFAVEEGFYQTIAQMLGVEHTFVEPYTKLTRWNNRKPGNGRYPGFGVIRVFSPSVIHVMLSNPISVNRNFTSMDSVLEFLRENIKPNN